MYRRAFSDSMESMSSCAPRARARTQERAARGLLREAHLVGSTNHVGDQIELMDVILAREESLAAEQLCEDAADRPDVDGLRILLPREHDLGSPIPPRRHVFGHEARVVLLGVRHSSEAEVTHLLKGSAQLVKRHWSA